MGQRVCKVSPIIGEVCDQHQSTPPKPSTNTAVQHPPHRDEIETHVDAAGQRKSKETRVIERGGEEEEMRVMERGGGEEGSEEELRRLMERGEEEKRRVMERGGGEEGGEEEERRVIDIEGENGGGGEEEERNESGRVQESIKRKKWWRRLASFFRAACKQAPESSSGQGEEKQTQDEGEKRKVAWDARSSDDYIFSHYTIGDQLGKGGFGVVFEGRRLEDDLKVAVKYVTKTKDTECLVIPDHPKPLPKEIALTILASKGPSVPEIIRLLDWQDRPDHFVMVLECPSPCEDLVQFMRRHGGRLDEEKVRHIMRQAAHAANTCCLRRVLHRDIKLDNLLINSETSEVKLIDFGCGDILRSSAYRSYCGTAAYCPPEYHLRGKYYGRQATAWSLGILMFVMLCGHFPSDYDLMLLKKKHWSRPNLSTECCRLLRALLKEKPRRRLSLGRILSHNWFKMSRTFCGSCRAPLSDGDRHVICVSCLGEGHAALALADGGCPHCELLPMATLRTRLLFFHETALPPAAVPRRKKRRAQRVPEPPPTVTSSPVRSPASLPASPESVTPGQRPPSAAASVVDDTEEVAIVEEDSCSILASETELTRLLTQAVQSLGLEWSTPAEPAHNRLDGCFLLGDRVSPPSRPAPFLPELHEELAKSWCAPFSARVRTSASAAFSVVDDAKNRGYHSLPLVEEAVAAHLCPPSAGRRAKTALPSKACRTTSAMHSRVGPERRTRQTVQEQCSSRRMVLTPTDSPAAVGDIRQSGSRPVCVSRKRSLFKVFLQEHGPRLAPLPALCFSPRRAPTSGVRADQGKRMLSATSSSVLEEPGLVPSSDAAGKHCPMADTGEEGPPLSSQGLDLASSPGALVPTCVGHQRVPVSLPEGVLNTITQARAPSTRRLYSSKWSVFSDWCTARGISPPDCGVTEVLSFLQELLDKGRTPSTLKVYVAAIAAFTKPTLGQSLGRNDLVIRFLRGAKRLNPPRPPSVPIWDLSTVLEAMKGAPFEPIQSVDIKHLSFKTVFLLALASVKRIGDLQALSVSATCMEFGPNDSKVILKPRHGYVPKSLNTLFRSHVISLSALPVSNEEKDASLLCPVRALRAYVSRSSVFTQTEQLFVSFYGRSKGLAVSKQSLSRWIFDAIALAYASMGLQCPLGVRAHSTRGMASSWAWSSGIALQDICMAAGWASPSTFIRFYNLEVPALQAKLLSVC
ncbi:unnamed protein product [Leuciscus chuanchicus]